jgi:hypothetical protein
VQVACSWFVAPTASPVTPPVVEIDIPVSVIAELVTVTVDALLPRVPLTVAVIEELPAATQAASPGCALPTLPIVTSAIVPLVQPVTASPYISVTVQL